MSKLYLLIYCVGLFIALMLCIEIAYWLEPERAFFTFIFAFILFSIVFRIFELGEHYFNPFSSK